MDKARRVASLPLNRISLTDPDVFFLVKNAPAGVLRALNQSTLSYVESVRSQIAVMKTASLLLTICSVILLAIVVLLIVRPPLYAVEQHKEGLWHRFCSSCWHRFDVEIGCELVQFFRCTAFVLRRAS